MSQELVTTAEAVFVSVDYRDGKMVTAQFPRYADPDATFIQLWLRNQRTYKTMKAYAANIARFYDAVKKPLPEVTLADLQDYAEKLYYL
jgi:hypothetical protein